MSWFKLDKNQYNDDRPTDKRPKPKDQRVYAKKEKLATQDKTKRCSLQPCKNPAVTTIKVGKQLKKLCKRHRDEYFRGQEKVDIIKELDFRKAGDML